MSLRKIGDYTITRKHGQGGMGTVYQALSPEGATVAVKTVLWPEVVDPHARWEAIRRFQREAHAALSLDHPNICKVLDCGADEDSLYIVMEFLDGDTVGQLIDLAGKIEPERAVNILRDVGEALAHAHDKGIVHRDVKPGNIMVLRTGRVKLTDFGVASVVRETGASSTGGALGTVYYMSPEQVRGEKADARSDIFSLGATFYEMVTGSRPFQGDTHAAVMHQILDGEPPPVEDAPTARVSHIVARCLQKDPQKRFQSARELIDSLRTVETDTTLEPTATVGRAEPEPAARARRRLPRPLRALKRWPVLTVAAAALVLGALLLLRPWSRPGDQPAATEVAAVAPTVVARHPPSLKPLEAGLVARYVYSAAARIEAIGATADGTLLVAVRDGRAVPPGVYVAEPGADADASDAYARAGRRFVSPSGIAVHPGDGRVLVADSGAGVVWEVSSRGAELRELTKIEGASDVLVAPPGLRGSKIEEGDVLVCAGSSADEDQFGLYKVEPQTGEAHLLLGPSDEMAPRLLDAAFGPDGNLHAVIEDRQQYCTIVTVSPEAQILAKDPYGPFELGLTPCTGPIAIDPGTGDLYFGIRHAIYRVPSGSTKADLYAEGKGEVTALEFLPRSSSLLVGVFSHDTGIGWVVSIAPYRFEGRLLVFGWYPKPTPTGEEVFAYLWKSNVASRAEVPLVPPPDMDRGAGDLHPDPATGELVYYAEGPTDAAEEFDKTKWICKSDLVGGEPDLLVGGILKTGINCRPLWSPDGSRIAFLRCGAPRKGENPCATGLDLWVMDRDGTNAEEVERAPRGGELGSKSSPTVSWDPISGKPRVRYGTQGPLVTTSPNGKSTVGERTKPGELMGEKGVWRQLCLADSDGGNERVLVQWFVKDSDITRYLMKERKDPHDRYQRDDAVQWLGPRLATWSPGSDRVAFVGVPDFDPEEDGLAKYQAEVWVYDFPTRTLARLTYNSYPENGLSWR